MPETLFEKLNDGNYADWRIKMEALLEEKELWTVVSGEETIPHTGPNSKGVKAFIRKQRLARAKIILHVENSQLPHTRYGDPKEIWDSLTRVHRSRGFGTLLSMRRKFFSMTKDHSQSMQAWIAAVRQAAFELESADFEVRKIDLIIALTQGLPESYSSFIVSLDATPPDQLKVDILIMRLLNEETRQSGSNKTHIESDTTEEALVATRERSSTRYLNSQKPNSNIRCFNCRGYGHYSRDCATPKSEDARSAQVIGNDGNDGDLTNFAF